jgi:hypothetical protein
MNCAAVQIGEGSGNTTTPTNPAAPSVSATKPSKPSNSGYAPSQSDKPDNEPQYSTVPAPTPSSTGGRPSYPDTSAAPSKPDTSATPSKPDNEDSSEEPSYNAPPEDNSDESDSEDTDSSDEDDDNSGDESDNEGSDNEDSENETDNKWNGRPGRWNPHRHQSYKYKMVDEHKCKIDSVAKRAECECKASSGCTSEKRALVERKAVRMIRRDALKKRTGACAWDSAPSMVVSYYTVDAACAPNAKMNVPESDTFEIGWMEPCGVVEGDGEYPIKEMDCNMFG